MFYLEEKPSPHGHRFDRWIFVPLSPEARKFILEHPLHEGKGVKKDDNNTRWELEFEVAAVITSDALAHRLKILSPDKLNYLKAVLNK